MSSTYGDKIKISVFGESHGNGIGVVMTDFRQDLRLTLTEFSLKWHAVLRARIKRNSPKRKRPPEGSFGYARQQADRCSALCRN